MRRMSLLVAALVITIAAVVPASAQVVRERTCTSGEGDASVTWDCAYHVKDYVIGTPLLLPIGYSCAGTCGPVMSFGLRDEGFSPDGVTGHLMSGRRVANGLELYFVWDSLKTTGNHAMGSAKFVMTLMMPDGAGGLTTMACPIDVRLKSTKD